MGACYDLPIFKGIVAIDIKDMKVENVSVYCEICDCKIMRSCWKKHLKTNKHIQNANGEVEEVEEVEKRRCGQCGCNKELGMFNGNNVTCNVCLKRWRRWAGNNVEKKKETNKRWRDGHKESTKEYNKEYNLREVWCGICECNVRKCKWKRHEETRKHKMGSSGGKVGGAEG